MSVQFKSRDWAPIPDLLSHYEPDTNGGCWLWLGAPDGAGYGRVNRLEYGPRPIRAHRVFYLHHKGPIPEGMHLLHRCDVRMCVNPSHMWIGTHLDNMRDMATKGRSRRGKGNWCSLAKQPTEPVETLSITHDGVTMTCTEWSARTGIPIKQLARRIRRGWDAERALTQPQKNYPKRGPRKSR